MSGDVFAQAPFGGGIVLAALFALVAIGPAVFTLAVAVSLYDLLVVVLTPWSDPGEVADPDTGSGRRKLRGRVDCEDSITEPLSGRGVAAFRTDVETAVREAWPEPRNWRTAETIDAGTAFDLTGDAGRVRVDPVDHHDAVVFGRPVLGERVSFGDGPVDEADRRGFGPDEQPPREFTSLLSPESDVDLEKSLRTTTRTIEDGDEVVVLGDLHWEEGEPLISSDDSSVFYVLAEDYWRTLRRGIVRNGGLTIAGAAVTLALLGASIASV